MARKARAGGGASELTPGERDALARLRRTFAELGPSPSMTIAGMLERARHVNGLRDLFAELELLLLYRFGGPGFAFDRRGLAIMVVMRFLDRYIERKGWHAAPYYKQFGIPAGRLRQAALQERLAHRRTGKVTEYPFEGVRALWPREVEKFFREEALESVRRGDFLP